MADTHKRGNLVKSIGDYLDKYELDGAEIDWEYPGRQGSKCNKYSSQDSANLMRFLHALRAHLHARFPDEQKLISLAVRVTPFDDSQGPMKDVSPFAEFVDYASIMAFDINGVWANTTGPNAPLRFTHNRGLPFSYTQAIDQWLEAKWPADKLVAGVPFYGRSLTTREVIAAKDGVDMYVPFSNEVPQGDLDDALWYDVCENVNSMSGIWNYRHLRDQGLLRSVNSTGEDWVRIWDKGSETPWLYNPRLRRMISYDDQESIARKVEYAKSKGIKGMMAWALHGDYQNELIGTVGGIGPLCRGEKTSNDQAASQ
ncbi:hypothetical protein FBU59_000119 [Linderina macrospora]|uniref:Uncharacterized protein n=1 Tax=Linderina macrospora TaxID=4868 RepID=A0ACC1JHQ7_9FUNG|nr:hypothetical protein FBU59_000119 [Linderina macrospora]